MLFYPGRPGKEVAKQMSVCQRLCDVFWEKAPHSVDS